MQDPQNLPLTPSSPIRDRGSPKVDEEGDRLKCPICSSVMTSQHEMTMHIRSHNNSNSENDESVGFSCKICYKILGSQSSLDRHVLVHSGERPFVCKICGVSFTTNGNMHRHMRSHCSDPTSSESSDENNSSKRKKIELNNNNHETPKKRKRKPDSPSNLHSCSRCSKSFISLHFLEKHLEDCHPDHDARCTECNLSFKNFRVLNLHRFMTHFSSNVQQESLSLVEFSTEKFPLIAQAMSSDSKIVVSEKSTEKDFFESLNLQKSPVKSTTLSTDEEHQGPEDLTPPDSGSKFIEEEQDCFAAEFRKMKLLGEFPCRLCSAIFPNLRALKSHNRFHLSISKSHFECNLCEFGSPDKTSVIRHMRSHNGERPFECRMCSFAFTTKANCERHVRNRHGLESAEESILCVDEDQPLDLSMDVLDLSTKRTNEPEEIVKRPVIPNRITLPTPFFIPPRPLVPNFAVLKDQLQSELIRGLQMSGGAIFEPERPVAELTVKPIKALETQNSNSIKMVIKNGVLIPKQKQRRYRTERPFACEHCSARFTLRSNMERHIKQQHAAFWAARPRTGAGRRPKITPLVKDLHQKLKSEPVLPPQILKPQDSDSESELRIDESPKNPKDADLASVSKLLDNATAQNFKQFFKDDGEMSDISDEEEGLVASHSENSGSEEKSDFAEVQPPKKKSAYSLAPNRVSCPYCARKFPWSSSLRRHVLTHTGQKPYKCPACPLLFTTKSNCDRHLIRKHRGTVSPALVPNIDSTIIVQEPLKVFERIKTPKKQLPKDEFPEPDKAHSPAQSSGAVMGLELPFKCHLCDGSFPERQDCLDHLKLRHDAEYNLLVAKGALESSSAEENVEDLDDEAASTKKFTDYSNRKVVCAFCLRRFWSAEDLRRHMRTHNGDRPFSCDVCRRRFTLKHSMLRHRKKHALLEPEITIETREVKTEPESDLISNLLGLEDKSILDTMLEKSADDAAKLLGVQKTN